MYVFNLIFSHAKSVRAGCRVGWSAAETWKLGGYWSTKVRSFREAATNSAKSTGAKGAGAVTISAAPALQPLVVSETGFNAGGLAGSGCLVTGAGFWSVCPDRRLSILSEQRSTGTVGSKAALRGPGVHATDAKAGEEEAHLS